MKKEYRVKKNDDIINIIHHKKRVGNKNFLIYKLKNHDIPHFRYAVSVNKKYGTAVKRNKIKRQVRAIVSKLDIKQEFDIFIVIKNNAKELEFSQIKIQIENLMKRLKILR
ncbi:MAG: ribonuclease P protein component [Candidatus Izimaplasma sp.]|nr:ribonuclease P protein component [Candidatus Izimaplasma bacterium]